MTGDNGVSGIKAPPLKLGFIISQGLEERPRIIPWMFAFHRDGSQTLEETFWGGRVTSKGAKKKIYNCKVSKVSALRGVSWTYLPITMFG